MYSEHGTEEREITAFIKRLFIYMNFIIIYCDSFYT